VDFDVERAETEGAAGGHELFLFEDLLIDVLLKVRFDV